MSKLRLMPYARSAVMGRFFARSARTSRSAAVPASVGRNWGKVTPAAVERALARRRRAAARAETTAAIEAARRGETERLGDDLRSVMAALDAE